MLGETEGDLNASRECEQPRAWPSGAWLSSEGLAQQEWANRGMARQCGHGTALCMALCAIRASRKGSSLKVQEPPTEATNRLNTWKGRAGFYINARSMKDSQEDPKGLAQSQRFGICGITETSPPVTGVPHLMVTGFSGAISKEGEVKGGIVCSRGVQFVELTVGNGSV